MRRIIAGIFLCLLMLQAIPILHFFSSKGEVFYINIDEEKTEEIAKEKKDSKEYLATETEITVHLAISSSYHPAIDNYYSSPILALQTPPPDAFV